MDSRIHKLHFCALGYFFLGYYVRCQVVKISNYTLNWIIGGKLAGEFQSAKTHIRQ